MSTIYRSLSEEEHYKALPLFTKLFPDLRYPSPEVARVQVAEVDGEVAGFWFLQLCAHAEPAGVDPQYAQEVSLPKLLAALNDSLVGCEGMEYYIYTATPEWDKPLQRAGFKPIGFAYAGRVPGGEDVSGRSSGMGSTGSN